MNVALLKEIRKHILAEPSLLNMDDWVMETKQSSCGTAGCIAGWACCLVEMKKTGKDFAEVSSWFVDKWLGDQGTELLELTERQAEELFYVPNWPRDLSNQYNEGSDLTMDKKASVRKKGRCLRARATAERIMRLIQEGDEE